MTPPAVTRRQWLRIGGALTTAAAADRVAGLETPGRPWDHRFLFYGDALVGHPGDLCYRSYSNILATVAKLSLRPDFILSGGDEIEGNTDEQNELISEWDQFLGLTRQHLGSQTVFYPCPSNHNMQSPKHEKAWRDHFGYLPQNGPAGQEGIAYAVRSDDLLIVVTHQDDRRRDGDGHVEEDWLNETLKKNSDAAYKIVVGHYPALAVNGLRAAPLARLVAPNRESFWKVLGENGVRLYLCAHIQSFDARVQNGILQVCSAAACNGSRPPDSEYQHVAVVTLRKGAIQVEAWDNTGNISEWFVWPGETVQQWTEFEPKRIDTDLKVLREPSPKYDPVARRTLSFRLNGLWRRPDREPEVTFVSGHVVWQATETIWIGLSGEPARLQVRLQPRHYFWQQTWTGPIVRPGERFDFEIRLDSGMGPGGILWRTASPGAAWNSFESACSSGINELRWPEVWQKGVGMLGDDDRVFQGDLRVEYAIQRNKYAPFY
jgi:Calcineurin-like phosphoesterase